MSDIPIVMYGKAYWHKLFEWLDGPVKESGMISGLDPHLVTMTDDVDEAVEIATSAVEPHSATFRNKSSD